MKAWQIISDGGIDALHLADVAAAAPGPGQVAVRIAARRDDSRSDVVGDGDRIALMTDRFDDHG